MPDNREQIAGCRSHDAHSRLHIAGRGKLSFCPFPFRGKVPKADRGSFCPLRSLASAHRRRGGSFFSLDRKETKDQGLELMSDKFVKAFLVISTSSDEGSERACCLGAVLE
jgi:hypothetical protein